jgi:phytoene synthase
VRATKEARLGQIRLAWWREAIERLDTHPAPDEPLLQAVAARLLPLAITGSTLGKIADGWAVLLAPMPLTEAELETHAADRGGILFDLAGKVLGEPRAELSAAGEAWALTDLAFHLSDAPSAAAALELARRRIAPVADWRWPGRLRSIGALFALARRDADAGLGAPRRTGSPGRVARALLHRVTGR